MTKRKGVDWAKKAGQNVSKPRAPLGRRIRTHLRQTKLGDYINESIGTRMGEHDKWKK